MNSEGLDPQKAQQLEALKRQLLNGTLTKEAFERLGRVRSVNPQLAAQAEMYILQLMQAGRLKQRLTDQKIRDVLAVLSEHKEYNIKRR